MKEEVVIRIKYDESTSKDILELVDILKEDEKPEWRTSLEGWKGGRRSLSERAVALMKAQVKSQSNTKNEKKGASASPKLDNQENLFG